ncbi:hypothetical protein AJ80_06265 [Polytolypa hystricis UAMH7299]|uniref:RRM domain-containing protein n=1 Tax=Polytolypa hystricis (strain UAMH7299) TaxID=1447883 RepID=A0A2B7XXX6_POLH7|nr:hypothetical protein AJ80_06265 [Polytolypa hystricis UAMH7299]
MDIFEKLDLLITSSRAKKPVSLLFPDLKRFEMQTQGQNSSAEAAPAQGQGAAPFNQDAQPRVPLVANHNYHQAGNNARDMNMPSLVQATANMNLQAQRAGAKPYAFKPNVGNPHTPGVDVAALQRAYNGQYMFVPNGAMFGTVPTSPYGQPHLQGADQNPQVPYLPTGYYPGFVPNPQLVQGNLPPYGWQYPVTGDISDMSAPRRDSWSSVEETNTGSPADMANYPEYYPAMGPHDRAPMPACLYQTPSPPQVGQPYVPYQMMKSGTGYVLQDLDALVQQDPPIPRAVPAMWTNPTELTLAKCLENREGITNVYIRGFLPETTDEMLHAYAARFGKIDRCKAIVDLDTGLCKGFGFVQFYSFEACENCIRGFFHLGYQASFAQKSRNSRLKDLEDKASTNIYCTNVPIDWTEADLRRHFHPYHVISEKISRDDKTGVSKEVGFARFENRELAEQVLSQFHNVTASDGVKLLLRFADTKAQKLLKQQSNERRAYRAGEYNYSVEVVQGSTPSPSLQRLQQAVSHFSPGSQASFPSPLGVGTVWTPATSISPSGPLANRSVNSMRLNSWAGRSGFANADATPSMRGRYANAARSLADNLSTESSKTVMAATSLGVTKSENSSPRKENTRAGSTSPLGSRKEVLLSTPRSSS